MDIKTTKEYKLKGERNNKPRQPLIWNDKLYVIFVYDKKGFTESRIQCLSLDKFNLLWEYQLSHVINNILISDNNTLIASLMNGSVVSFNLENGQEVWRFTTEESNIGPISNEYKHKIIVSGIQARATSTWCIDTINGNVLWKQSNTGHSYIPKIYDDLIFNCIGNDIFCMNLENGLIIWRQNEPSTYLFNPKIFKQFVIASGHGIINIYDLQLGQMLTRIETGEQSSIREIINDEENIYFGDENGYFYSYNLSNLNAKLNWKLQTGGKIQTIPAISGQNIFLLNDASKFFAIDKISGEPVFEKKIKGEGNISGVTLANDKIYFSCGGGSVYECEEK